MQQQVFHDLLQDLGKSQDALAELPFLLVLQQDLARLGRFAQCRFFDVGQPGYGPENMTRLGLLLGGITTFLLQRSLRFFTLSALGSVDRRTCPAHGAKEVLFRCDAADYHREHDPSV